MFKLEIKTGGAAFADPATGEYNDYYEGAEICRILKGIESSIRNGNAVSGNVIDINGNVVGRWSR